MEQSSAVVPLPVQTERTHARPVRLTVNVIGGLSLSVGGLPIVLPNRKARALVAYLALEVAASFSRDRLSGLLWGDATEARARSSLRTTLHELRKSLHSCSCSALRIGQDEVSLARDQVDVDLEVALNGIEFGSLSETIATQPASIGLLLSGYEDLSEEFRAWLEQSRAAAHERLTRALGKGYVNPHLGQRERRRLAEAALRLDPLDEAACRTVMRLAAEAGEIGVALRAYATLYDGLGTELDMEPSEPTQVLVAEIKRGRIAAAPMHPTTGSSDADGAAVGPASIVVLPFSSDPTFEGFADGVTEGIVHVLSGIGELFVIAQGTARSFGRGNHDPRTVGRKLGVAFVLSGRVTAAPEGLRVFTELSDASNGVVIRTERYEATTEALFVLQDRIAAEVVGVIAPAVKEHSLARARRKPPGTLNTYELMLQGLELQYELNETSFGQAGERLYQAIEQDPDYSPAYAHAATWHNFRIGQGWSTNVGEDARQAAHCAARALELDRNNAAALAIQGQVLSFNTRNYTAAREYLDRALVVGPSSVVAWTLSSCTHGWSGNGALAAEHATRAMRLSPFDPFVFFAEHMLSQAHYVQGDYDTAIAFARSVARRNPRLTSNLRTLTAALVASGAREAALQVAARMLTHEPGFRLNNFEQRTPLCAAVREGYVAQLRLAGLPD